ncbi:MAG: hypothetical protein ACLQPN_15515 [Bryobacteraceae bacterium]
MPWIEKVIREELAPGIELECWKDFDSRGFRVWFTINDVRTPVGISMEKYEDDNWKLIVTGGAGRARPMAFDQRTPLATSGRRG